MLKNILTLVFVSMLPVIELRGGIPIGLAMGLSFWPVYAVCVIGNLIPVPFLIPFARHVLRWCATWPYVGKYFQRIIDTGHRKMAKIKPGFLFTGLFLFVAIPLPGTGAWTGCLIATLLQLRIRQAFPPIALGVLTSGIIMGLLSFGVGGLLGMIG